MRLSFHSDHAFEEEPEQLYLDDEDIQDILFDLLCLAMDRRVSHEPTDDQSDDQPFHAFKELMETAAFKRIMKLLSRFDRFRNLECLSQEPLSPMVPLIANEEMILFLEGLAGDVFNRRALRGWKSPTADSKMLIREFGIPSDHRPSLWSKLLRKQMESDPDVSIRRKGIEKVLYYYLLE